MVALLPYYTVYAAHFLLHPDATGFIQNDQPYYVANGREIFERGNGFAHPNPFDPDPNAPVIYFHWLTWLYGAAVKFLGTDPAFVPLLLGAIAALALGLLTLAIIEIVLPDRRFLVPLFLLAMWGGGVLALGGLLSGGSGDEPLADRLLAFDPESGWWFLNWGRNVMYPTESVYHALVAATWLALLRGRENWAVLGGALLAATHPFSGLQLLGFLGFWLTYRRFVLRTGPAAARLGAWFLIVGAFLYYYVVYLNRFPQHVAMQRDWTENPEDWIVPLRTMLLAYGPVAALAVWRLVDEPRPWKSDVVLFAGCFCITLLLIKHDLLVRNAKQPIHFTRGYEWMPLFLLGLPKLQQLFIRVWEHGRLGRKVAFVALLFGLGTLDNLTFVAASWTSEAPIPHYLTRSEREMFAWMEEQRLTGVLLCTDRNLSYLAATYTSVRPYFGHGHNTPDFFQRIERMNAYFRFRQPAPWLEEIDYLLVAKRMLRIPKAHQGDWRPDGHWKKMRENDECLLLARIHSSQTTNQTRRSVQEPP
jgi:hypothetical protein